MIINIIQDINNKPLKAQSNRERAAMVYGYADRGGQRSSCIILQCPHGQTALYLTGP